MIKIIAAIVVALISFFISKKSGASSAQAAAVGAAAGVGSYYVATETEWGKALFSNANGGEWVVAKDSAGNTITDDQGRTVYVPAGEKATVGADGKVAVASDGTWFTKTLDTTKAVLTSWGGAGTAAVIGTTAVATSSGLQKYLPWLLIGGFTLLILK